MTRLNLLLTSSLILFGWTAGIPAEKEESLKNECGDLERKVVTIDDRQVRVLGLKTGEVDNHFGISTMMFMDLAVEKVVRETNWSRTPQQCMACRHRKPDCTRCGGTGILVGQAAAMQYARQHSERRQALAIGEVTLPSGRQLVYDPHRELLVNPSVAKRSSSRAKDD